MAVVPAALSQKSEEYVKQMSKLFGRKPNSKPLTEYQRRMNEASEELCFNDSNLLADRKLLLEMARERVDSSGYQYKKGKSRSKRLNPTEAMPTPKRKKTSKEYRTNRISELEERIQDLSDQIGFKMKRRDCASDIKNYKECDKLTEQLSALKSERRQLEVELASLTKSEKKSRWYYSKAVDKAALVSPPPESVSPVEGAYRVTRVMTSPSSSASRYSRSSLSPTGLTLLPPRTPSDSENVSRYRHSTPLSPRSPTSTYSDSNDTIVLTSDDESQGYSSSASSTRLLRQPSSQNNDPHVPTLKRSHRFVIPAPQQQEESLADPSGQSFC